MQLAAPRSQSSCFESARKARSRLEEEEVPAFATSGDCGFIEWAADEGDGGGEGCGCAAVDLSVKDANDGMRVGLMTRRDGCLNVFVRGVSLLILARASRERALRGTLPPLPTITWEFIRAIVLSARGNSTCGSAHNHAQRKSRRFATQDCTPLDRMPAAMRSSSSMRFSRRRFRLAR